jgi:hypothetical protein
MVEDAFWFCMVLGLYPYAGYPLLARLLAGLLDRRVMASQAHGAHVTVVIQKGDSMCLWCQTAPKMGPMIYYGNYARIRRACVSSGRSRAPERRLR